METSITDFQYYYLLPTIHNLGFQKTHVCIIGINNCGKPRPDAFKSCYQFNYIKTHQNYTDSFVEKIKLKNRIIMAVVALY